MGNHRTIHTSVFVIIDLNACVTCDQAAAKARIHHRKKKEEYKKKKHEGKGRRRRPSRTRERGRMCYPHEVDKGLRPDDLHAVPFIIDRHDFDDEGLAHALHAHDVVTGLHQTHICAHQHHFLQQCLSCSTSEASLVLSRRRRRTEGGGKVKKRVQEVLPQLSCRRKGVEEEEWKGAGSRRREERGEKQRRAPREVWPQQVMRRL